MHIALDGWTSPLVSTYLGIVVIWHETGNIHRAILEFVRYDFVLITMSWTNRSRLTEKHGGKYMAEIMVACVEHFSLDTMACVAIRAHYTLLT